MVVLLVDPLVNSTGYELAVLMVAMMAIHQVAAMAFLKVAVLVSRQVDYLEHYLVVWLGKKMESETDMSLERLSVAMMAHRADEQKALLTVVTTGLLMAW